MKKLNAKRILQIVTVVLALVSILSVTVFATGFDKVTKPIVDLLNSLLTPLLAIVGAAGSLYCVVLGVKFAKAEEPQEREKAKSQLKNAIIGFVLIFVLMLALKILMPIMIDWVNNNGAVDPE